MTGRKLFFPSLLVVGGVMALAIYVSAGPRPSPYQAGAPSAVDAAQAVPAEITVGQRDKMFSRDRATLTVGDRIKFVNDDRVAHNIYVTGPGDKTRNSGVQGPGENATMVFDAPGTYDVECGIHPQMRMTVEVK